MKVKLIKIDRDLSFILDFDITSRFMPSFRGETTTVDLTYKIKKWYYFGIEKTLTERHSIDINSLDNWCRGLNKALNVWRYKK
tara:strand:+ start:1047 stop:1295 length:249 start_codon:yes stop_codon:yes gene_type:complete